jgi:hypothetical protein
MIARYNVKKERLLDYNNYGMSIRFCSLSLKTLTSLVTIEIPT